MQNGFVSTKSASVIPVVVDLVHQWATQGLPYVMTRFFNEPGSPFETIMGWHRLQGPPETDIVEPLREFIPGARAVIDKPTYSMFTEEGAALVQRHGWRNIVIAGISTEACVLLTAADAFERGLVPWIVCDAVYSDAGSEAHAAGLLAARRLIGRDQLINTMDLDCPSSAGE